MASIRENLSVERELARRNTEKNPSMAQAKAGNYKKGKLKFNGILITIENPKGSYRRGKDKNGHEWKTLMHNDYGYFNRTVGKDGDAIDVFLGPNLNSEKIFPIDQYYGDNFDETKVMIGFNTAEEAKAAYLSNYEKGWKGFKYITEVDLPKFKKWLYDGYRQRKPFAKYIRLTEDKERQFNIIQDTNPMLDDYHLGIRSVDNIKTFEEAMAEAREDYEEYGTYSSYPDTPNSVLERAMETGMITVYSSKPIVNGNFVTTSKMCARDYAGGGRVYSETLPVTDIAWINVEEGQVARMQQINEQWSRVYDLMEDYTHADLLEEFIRDKRNGITIKKWNTIPFEQYRNVRERFLQNPEMARIPLNLVMSWFDIIVHNTLSISYITDFAGHSQYFPEDDIMYVFSKQVDGFHDGCEFLESQGFYDWAKLPDGSDAWSDYGLSPLYKIIDEFSENMEAGQIMTLIDRALDVGHCRGNLASAFIEGGSKSCSTVTGGGSLQESKRRKNDEGNEIPEKCECGGKVCVQIHGEPVFICDKCGKYYGTVPFVKESFNVTKALKQLKKRRDPANIENWNEDMSDKKINENVNELSPNLLQHAADKARGLNRYSQADNLEAGADAAAGSEFNEPNKVKATPRAISYINGKYACTITNEGNYGTKSANYFVDVTNEHGTISDFSFPRVLKTSDKALARKLAMWWSKYGKGKQLSLADWHTYFDFAAINEIKKANPPKDVAAAIAKGNRDADIEAHGKSTDFRTTITKNPKAYTRKVKHKKPIAEGRKVYLTEEQFRAYCRQILREKREKDYIKGIISESVDEIYRLRTMGNPFEELKMAVEGAVDYLNNEGVINYQEPALEQALEKGTLDYKDICKTALWYIENDKKFGDEVKQLLQDYLNTGSNPEVEDKICVAVSEYLDNPTCY